jgi:hypothetical protein
MSVPDEGYSIWYLRFYYYHWVDTAAGVILVPASIIRLVVNASVLTLFIKYIFMEIYSS